MYSNRFAELGDRDLAQKALLELDGLRQWLGQVCEILGYGFEPSPHEAVETGTPARLFRYAPRVAGGPVAVFVPAPIKTAEVWDVAPAVSVVQRHIEAGFRVYLVEWPRVASGHRSLGLDDYVSGMLRACVATVRRETREDQVFLSGHSVGGVMAALFAARYPETVRALITLGAPLHFGADIGALGRLVTLVADTRVVIGEAETVPGSLLDLIALTASPQTFLVSRALDWFACLRDPARMHLHLRVERWSLDERAMPRRLFVDLVERLYREDAFVEGRIRIAGRALAPSDLITPIAFVVSRHCDIAPPESVLPVLDAVGTRDRKLFWCPDEDGVSMQHVGMLLGPNAHHDLWPLLLAWMQARW